MSGPSLWALASDALHSLNAHGVAEEWAAHLNVGATIVGRRPFDGGAAGKARGLPDLTFGVRDQIFHWWNTCPTNYVRVGLADVAAPSTKTH